MFADASGATDHLSPVARAQIRDLAESRIREVANAGFDVEGVAPFWFGESDQPTPDFIRAAAIAALNSGRTFYTHNMGAAALRGAVADYVQARRGIKLSGERVAVTSSGVSALMLSAEALISPGDKVAVVTPVWPNLVEIPRIMNAEVTAVPLSISGGRWSLDLDRALSLITPDTRALYLNSPGNPTGWVITPEAQAVLLDHCRRLGVWIIADDVYERLSYVAEDGLAPSFLSIADPEDRLISVNSFSKAWRMTGWRLGWMIAPKPLMNDLGKLLEFNTSCAPDFVQAAGVTALREGEAIVAEFRQDLKAKRDRLFAGLEGIDGVETVLADGGMYLFLRIEGLTNSVAAAKALIRDAKLGLAPGAAFAKEGEGWLRWCFAATNEKLDEGLRRFRAFMDGTPRS
jgi:aspartate aminotransferase